jgi:hypothetical protein
MPKQTETTLKKKLAPPKEFPFPWERRGFGFYVPGTNKRICEVPLAWKTSAQAQQISDVIKAALEAYNAGN